jgi:hypothetical protein
MPGAAIRVEKKNEGEFLVTVEEGRSRTTHSVAVEAAYAEQLTGGQLAVEELLRRSFEFLLRREPKESILRQFDLKVISHYFPEYEREIKKGIGNRE